MKKQKTLRQLRKIIRRRNAPLPFFVKVRVVVRACHRVFFRVIRLLCCSCTLFWLRKVHHPEYLPRQGPAIIVSNHLSYFDWAILTAIYSDKYLVFIANKKLAKRNFIGFLMTLNILIFIDPLKPGNSFYREALRRLNENSILVIYPEGQRSRSGQMLEPRGGFLKLALRTGAPIIPVGMMGTFEILPPHQHFPNLRRCEVVVGRPLKVCKEEPLFEDLFMPPDGDAILTHNGEKIAARRIMDVIRQMTGQDWEKPIAGTNDVS